MTAVLRDLFLRPSAKNYLGLCALLLGIAATSSGAELLLRAVSSSADATVMIFFEISVIVVLGFLAYEIAKPTAVPSFAVAIVIGMIERSALSPLTENSAILSMLILLGAVVILFDGALDVPFLRFRTLLAPILSLSVVGTLVTAFLFSAAMLAVGGLLGMEIPLAVAALCGMALAPTDPAAIIPSFKALTFLKPRVKDIAISASAISDVLAAVFFGLMLAKAGEARTLGGFYGLFFSASTVPALLREAAVGVAVGFAGFGILHLWSGMKQRSRGSPGEADAALFLVIPLLCYVFATLLHGSGFLAVFTSGLLFQIRDHVRHVGHFLSHTVEGFMKPLIFMLLGAVIDVPSLIATAPIGLLMAAIFILVLRPVSVLLSLGPFAVTRQRLGIRELLFLSCVRETGVIPGVLLIGLQVAGIPGSQLALDVGLWIILSTLILLPPLTALMARKLDIAYPTPPLRIAASSESTAVLCSRSRSFLGRIGTVAQWADKNGIGSVTLLHCPEDKYTEPELKIIEREANAGFEAINAELAARRRPKLSFHFLGRPGLLQDNILELIGQKNISIVFVGKKMLDYRLSDVKKLDVPFVFLP